MMIWKINIIHKIIDAQENIRIVFVNKVIIKVFLLSIYLQQSAVIRDKGHNARLLEK